MNLGIYKIWARGWNLFYSLKGWGVRFFCLCKGGGVICFRVANQIFPTPPVLNGHPLSINTILLVYWPVKMMHSAILLCNIWHLGAVHSCQHLNEWTKHTLSQTFLPLKKCTHQHFCNGSFSMKMIKKWPKMLKGINLFFIWPPPLPKIVYFVHSV